MDFLDLPAEDPPSATDPSHGLHQLAGIEAKAPGCLRELDHRHADGRRPIGQRPGRTRQGRRHTRGQCLEKVQEGALGPAHEADVRDVQNPKVTPLGPRLHSDLS
jgi:hypothetical protein